jgi:dimeric dUTPase (all-alpha-NTP-PPase superfamily)
MNMPMECTFSFPWDFRRYTLKPDQSELTLQILQTYSLVSALLEHYDEKTYARAFGSFLNLLPLLGYTGEEAIAAYKKKLGVNYQRQEAHY